MRSGTQEVVQSQGAGQSLVWDGRDDRGRSVPTGTYFARVVTMGRTATAKIAIVR